MEILLDTHILLWWLSDDPQLSQAARDLIGNPENTIVVSAASAWEVAIKTRLGKLEFEGEFEQEVRQQGFALLPIGFAHAAETLRLPEFHRDPFDRMLVAQARVENLQLLTDDARIRQYPVMSFDV